ncbi:MAG: RIP metalloprotease RseP [Bacteroidetes bacterium]|nr:RIP metalloprotease RseP [Bacteroidota bacterium]
METLSTIFYFLITIGVLVFVHEFGHFIAAISCGMRAEVFALGMGNRIWGWNKKIGSSFGSLPKDLDLEGHTDYRISAFPIGGYVKISGMIDESLDTEIKTAEPQPWEYRAKPVWQRMIVISAGVIMNILLAVAIFWGINYVQGDQFWQTNEIGMVVKDTPAEKAGLQIGDKILFINREKIDHWEAIQTAIYLDNIGKDISMEIDRGGKIQTIKISKKDIPDISESSFFGVFPINTEAFVSMVLPGKPAEKAGLLANDIILSINGTKVFNQNDVIKIVKSSPLKPITIEIKRQERIENISVTPSDEGLIGIQVGSKYTGPILEKKYSLIESFPRGVKQTFGATTLFIRSIWQLVAGRADFSKSVGGPVKIAQMATRSAEIGVMSFLAFMALLSISLAVMNILPVPALDGGHLIVLLYEMIFRKPLSHTVQIRIQQVGMVLLLSFMAYVLYNDIFG